LDTCLVITHNYPPNSITLTKKREFCLLPRATLSSGLIQEIKNNASFQFFAVKKTYIEAQARPRKSRNLAAEAVGEEQPDLALFSRRVLGIHCSRPNLDSGLFRVIQYHASTQTNLREKTGMTALGVVLNKRRNTLIQAFFMLPLLALSEVLFLVRRRHLFFRTQSRKKRTRLSRFH